MRRHVVRLFRAVHTNGSSAVVSSARRQILRQRRGFLTGCMSSSEGAERRNHLFTLEKKRQAEEVGRVEKIEVQYKGLPKDTTLVMNKDVSTPHDCAKHLSEWHSQTSALALVNGTALWDMNRPLTESCTLELQHFTSAEPYHVNKAFWRTCSMVLGACVAAAFKQDVPVQLHSFPGPDVRSGSFVYDVELPSLAAWAPSDTELRALSAEYVRLCRRGAPLERLRVSRALALEMFADSAHKARQIPSIATKGDGKVTLYRVERHVDISRGPMISHTAQIGRVTVAAVHRITGDKEAAGAEQLYRFQGVALPVGIIINHFAYGVLEERARKLNPARSPYDPFELDEPGQMQQSVRN